MGVFDHLIPKNPPPAMPQGRTLASGTLIQNGAPQPIPYNIWDELHMSDDPQADADYQKRMEEYEKQKAEYEAAAAAEAERKKNAPPVAPMEAAPQAPTPGAFDHLIPKAAPTPDQPAPTADAPPAETTEAAPEQPNAFAHLIPKETEKGEEKHGAVVRGLIRGTVSDNPKMFGEAMEGLGEITNSPDIIKFGQGISAKGDELGKDVQPRVPSYTDIPGKTKLDTVGRALTYAGEQVGSAIGSSIPSLAVGGATALVTANPAVGMVLGASAPSFIQNYGDVYASLKSDAAIAKMIADGKIDKKTLAQLAVAAATPMAALDVVGLAKITAPLTGEMKSAAKEQFVKYVVKHMVSGGTTEGLTEGLQELISQIFQSQIGDTDLFTKERINSVVDNVFGGILGGTTMSGATAGASHVRERLKLRGKDQPPEDGAPPPGPEGAPPKEGLQQAPDQAGGAPQTVFKINPDTGLLEDATPKAPPAKNDPSFDASAAQDVKPATPPPAPPAAPVPPNPTGFTDVRGKKADDSAKVDSPVADTQAPAPVSPGPTQPPAKGTAEPPAAVAPVAGGAPGTVASAPNPNVFDLQTYTPQPAPQAPQGTSGSTAPVATPQQQGPAAPVTLQNPEVTPVAEQITEAEKKFETIQERKSTYRRWLDELAQVRKKNIETNPPPEVVAIDQQIAKAQNALKNSGARRRPELEQRVASLQAQREQAVKKALSIDTPDMKQVRAKLMEEDFKAKELAPEVSRARQGRQPSQAAPAQPAPAQTATPQQPQQQPQTQTQTQAAPEAKAEEKANLASKVTTADRTVGMTQEPGPAMQDMRGKNPVRDKLQKELTGELRKAGVPEDIAVKVVYSIDNPETGERGVADGRFFDKLIEVATDMGDNNARAATFHEIIHALRERGLIPDKYWNALSEAAQKHWINKYGVRKKYDAKKGYNNEDAIIEEAIAHAATDYAKGKLNPPGILKQALQHIFNIIEGFRNGLKYGNWKSSEGIFKAIREGRGAAEVNKGAPSSRPETPAERFSRRDKDEPKSQEQNRISTRVPTAKKNTEAVHTRSDLTVGLESAEASGDAYKKNTALLRKIPGINYSGVPRKDKDTVAHFLDHVVDNLLYLYDGVPAEIRSRSKLWYVGANKIAHEWSEEFGITPRQSAGVLAALSPQMDWFKNVGLANRLIKIWKGQQDTTTTPKMLKWIDSKITELNEKAEAASVALVKEKRKKKIKKLTGAMKSATKGREKLEEFRAAAANRPLSKITDKTNRAMWVRIYDEAHNSRQYNVYHPEGDVGPVMKTLKGNTQKIGWGAYGEIAKAISVLIDGSLQNISQQMGGNHKVRNFYNNIIAPESKSGDITVDTHAIAAALLRPLAGKDKEVKHGLGMTGSKSAEIGQRGLYGIYAEAYRRAAAARGILPREMQSITWEAVRGLYKPTQKSNKALLKAVNDTWAEAKNGSISRDEAQRRVAEIAGGVEPPEWSRADGRDLGKREEDGLASDAGKLDRGELGRGDTGPLDVGTRGGASRTSAGSGSGAGNDGGGRGRRYSLRDVADREVDGRSAASLRSAITTNLSASTWSIPGLKALTMQAAAGDKSAARLLNDIAKDSLTLLFDTVKSAKVQYVDVEGLYQGDSEPALAISASFDEADRSKALAVLAQFAKNFNQQQIHVRTEADKDTKVGHSYVDGSYNTNVVRFKLKAPLPLSRVNEILSDAGIVGANVSDEAIVTYYSGDPNDAEAIQRFIDAADRVGTSLGEDAAGYQSTAERLWAYGTGPGATNGYEEISGKLYPPEGDRANASVQRIAARIAGRFVKPTPQAETTPEEQRKLQKRIAVAYEAMRVNAMDDPNVRRAYTELAEEVIQQYEAIPVKVEIFTGDEPYGGKNMSEAMRADVNYNNHLFIYGTDPTSFGPEGVTYDNHPLLEKTEYTDINGKPLLVNDLLRAVHDYYAHTMSPVGFGPKGEEAAWRNHMLMTKSPWARWALTSETRGQNSWVNFRDGMDKMTLKDRGFAIQKVDLLPIEFVRTGERDVDASLSELPKTAAKYSLREKPKSGFYSALTRAIEDHQQKQALPGIWSSMIDNMVAKGTFKKAEVEWSGVKDWLKEQRGPVTRESLADYLRSTEVDVKEVMRGAPHKPTKQVQEWIDEFKALSRTRLRDPYGMTDKDVENLAWLDDKLKEAGYINEDGDLLSSPKAAKFGEYVLPGGDKNYRELLLTLPQRYTFPDVPDLTVAEEKRMVALAQKMRADGNLPADEMAEWQKLSDQRRAYRSALDDLKSAGKNQQPYTDGHYPEENILAHIRFNDRTGPNGENILHVEEIQSDWHQKGRERGYRGDGKWFAVNTVSGNSSKPFDTKDDAEAFKASLPFTVRENIVVESSLSSNAGGVPDAPYKDTKEWTALAAKHVLKYAVENGYDGVTWTTGKQQAERYRLSKVIKHINVAKEGNGNRVIDLYVKNRRDGVSSDMVYEVDADGKIVDGYGDVGKNISAVLGKGMAEKIMSAGDQYISGDGLDIGGKGMITSYDEIIPSVFNKLARAFGPSKTGSNEPPAVVGKTTIIASDDASDAFQFGVTENERGGWDVIDQDDERVTTFKTQSEAIKEKDRLNERTNKKGVEVHYLPITQPMRDTIEKVGQTKWSLRDKATPKKSPEEVRREISLATGQKGIQVVAGGKGAVFDPLLRTFIVSDGWDDVQGAAELAKKPIPTGWQSVTVKGTDEAGNPVYIQAGDIAKPMRERINKAMSLLECLG
jgi:hypothetical protein